MFGFRKSWICTLILLFFLVPKISQGTEAYFVEIRGTINPATSHLLGRAIDQAEGAKANLILVELDTPGGLVSSVREMIQKIDQSKIPVIIFTTPAGAAATSAGALLMISSHLAAMSPGTNIGAAHPVGPEGEEIKGPMSKKAVNDISAFARAMAKLRQRNVEAASEVVTKSNSYSADEALRTHLIEVIASDRTALWKSIDGRQVRLGSNVINLQTDPAPTLHKIEMTVGESLLHYLSHPNIAALLMTLGILLIYTELNVPGFGLPGVLGGLCLITAFIAFQAIPIRAGGIVLLVLGTLLMLSELYAPSGALALGGVLLLILGFLWVVDPEATDLRLSPFVLVVIGGSLLFGALGLAYATSRIKRLSEEAMNKSGGGDLAGVHGYKAYVKTVNPNGRSGQVLVRGEIWDFISEESLQKDDVVNIKKADGLKLEVFRHQE